MKRMQAQFIYSSFNNWEVTIYKPLFKYLFQSSNENRNSPYPHEDHVPLGEIFHAKK